MSVDSTDLILRAAIEFGPDYLYEIVNGGLGPTLRIDARTKDEAKQLRPRVPLMWEGLYTIVLYQTPRIQAIKIKS